MRGIQPTHFDYRQLSLPSLRRICGQLRQDCDERILINSFGIRALPQNRPRFELRRMENPRRRRFGQGAFPNSADARSLRKVRPLALALDKICKSEDLRQLRNSERDDRWGYFAH